MPLTSTLDGTHGLDALNVDSLPCQQFRFDIILLDGLPCQRPLCSYAIDDT
jgi:hypothetical protein